MSLIRPFRALRPSSDKAALVAAVPYDVVNTTEAKELALENPYSFLHISRSEIDLPVGTDPYSPEIYKKALSNLERLIKDCPMIKDSPSLYLYRLRMGNHEQIGVAGTFSIDEYDQNLIKKHEKTRPDKEDDRTKHILELSAQTGPVFLAYPDVEEITQEMMSIQESSPLYNFRASDNVFHTIWSIPNYSVLVQAFSEKIPALYIADGHHRAAAASRVRAECKRQNSHHQGDEDYNYFLAVAFPASQLQILPYHRAIKDLQGMSEGEFLEKIKESFYIQPGTQDLPQQGEFGMALKSGWYKIRPKILHGSHFDVTILQDSLLNPMLGIQDPRTDKRIEFIGGIRGTQELERLVQSGQAAVAFSVHPVQIQDLIQVADQGGIMPPKSTWFEPKLRDGLLSHCIY